MHTLTTTFLASLALTFCLHSAQAQTTLPGEAAYNLGNFEAARKELTAAEGFDTNPSLILLLAKIDIAENKLDVAENRVEEIISEMPNNAAAHALRGQVFGMRASRASLFKAGRHAKKSLASFEKALELDPLHEEALVGMVRYRLNAPALFGGSVDKAASAADQLVKVNPVLGGLELANVYAKQGDEDRRVALLEELATEHTQDPRAPLALGFIEQGAGNYAKAFDYFEAAVNGAVDNPEHTNPVQAARYQMGRTIVLSKSDDVAEIEQGITALSDYLTGAAFGDLPEFAWAHYRRGLLYERLDDKAAEAQLDFSAAANTEDRDLQRALKSH